MSERVGHVPELAGEFLCSVIFDVAGGIVALGASPWGERRVGYISGGRFEGPRLRGTVLPGGGNWSTSGRLANGDSVGTFDARAVWRTDDGASIYLTYAGRSVVPADVRDDWTAGNPVAASRYYLRIAPVFETADPRYDWLNGILAVGVGERLDAGVRHHIHAVA